MYKSAVATKIISFAELYRAFGILLSVIGGISITSINTTVGIIAMVVSCFFVWLIYLLLFGFAELISDTAENLGTNKQILAILEYQNGCKHNTDTTNEPA